jgi:hypothetical protein
VSLPGTTVAIRGPEWLLTDLGPLLQDLTVDARPTRVLEVATTPQGKLQLLDDGRVVQSDVAEVIAAATVVWRCNAIAAASDHVMIHAAAVGGASAVLLPGASGAGKSTLAAACVRVGMSYLSDEYAVVDPHRGVIVPYAKPFSLEREVLIASSQLRPGSRSDELAPGAIVFPRYDPRGEPSCTRLAPSAALLLLAANTLDLTGHDGRALPWLTGLALSCPAWQRVYEDPAGAVEHAVELATRSAAPVRPAEVIGPVTGTTVTTVLGDELAVLDLGSGEVHVLNPGAALVWTSVPDAADRHELEALVVERARGSLERGAVAATIDHLAALGLLHPPDGAAGTVPGRGRSG